MVALKCSTDREQIFILRITALTTEDTTVISLLQANNAPHNGKRGQKLLPQVS